MTIPDDNEKTLELLQELPAEMSMEQVSAMVAAFPLVAGTAAWLAGLKLHLNSILMTTTGTLIIGGSIYLMNASDPTPREEHASSMPATTPEVVVAPAEEVPAVVLELPAPEPVRPVEQEPVPAPVSAPPVEQPVVVAPPPPPTEEVAVMGLPVPEPLVLPAVPLRMRGSEKKFELKGFNSIRLQGYMDVAIEQGDFSVIAVGEQDVLERLHFKVDGEVLVLDVEDNKDKEHACTTTTRVMVRLPEVRRVDLIGAGDISMGRFSSTRDFVLHLNGAGDVRSSGFAALENLTLDISGAGDVEMDDVQVSALTKLDLNGAADIRLSGRTDRLQIVIKGAGDVDASELEAGSCKVSIHGAGDANVNCNGELEREVRGVGSINSNAGGMGPRGVGIGPY